MQQGAEADYPSYCHRFLILVCKLCWDWPQTKFLQIKQNSALSLSNVNTELNLYILWNNDVYWSIRKILFINKNIYEIISSKMKKKFFWTWFIKFLFKEFQYYLSHKTYTVGDGLPLIFFITVDPELHAWNVLLRPSLSHQTTLWIVGWTTKAALIYNFIWHKFCNKVFLI